jgi:hypothetical protein
MAGLTYPNVLACVELCQCDNLYEYVSSALSSTVWSKTSTVSENPLLRFGVAVTVGEWVDTRYSRWRE